MLTLLQEAGEIGPGHAQQVHLVGGIQRIIGGAKTDWLVDAGFGPGRAPRVERLVTSFTERSGADVARTCQEMSRSGCRANPAYRTLTQRLPARAVSVHRRGLVTDAGWYGSDFFNSHLRACGLDDQLYSVRPLTQGRVDTLGVTRGLKDPPFTEEDRNLLELFHEQLAVLQAPQQGPAHPRLTQRQRDVLRCLLAGAAEKAVAGELGISQQTVHTHVKALYAAYRVQSRAELLVKCLDRRAVA
jgi:DNA-binding CsgD family transcriptional regulator